MKAAALVLAFIVALGLLASGHAHADEKSIVQLVFALDLSDAENGVARLTMTAPTRCSSDRLLAHSLPQRPSNNKVCVIDIGTYLFDNADSKV